MSYPIPRLVNGKAYEWADILLNIMGAPMRGALAVEYEEPQSMANVKGPGRFPSARIYGSTDPKASITLLMSDVQALQAVAPLGRLQDIPEFDIVVMYLDPANNTVKDIVRSCRFMTNGRSSAAGDDKAIEVKLDLVTAGIDFNQ